jgi:hypothetical protein
MKGKIIVIDNELEETKDLIVKQNYILAHSEHIQIGKYKIADHINNQLDYSLVKQFSQIQSINLPNKELAK